MNDKIIAMCLIAILILSQVALSADISAGTSDVEEKVMEYFEVQADRFLKHCESKCELPTHIFSGFVGLDLMDMTVEAERTPQGEYRITKVSAVSRIGGDIKLTGRTFHVSQGSDINYEREGDVERVSVGAGKPGKDNHFVQDQVDITGEKFSIEFSRGRIKDVGLGKGAFFSYGKGENSYGVFAERGDVSVSFSDGCKGKASCIDFREINDKKLRIYGDATLIREDFRYDGMRDSEALFIGRGVTIRGGDATITGLNRVTHKETGFKISFVKGQLVRNNPDSFFEKPDNDVMPDMTIGWTQSGKGVYLELGEGRFAYREDSGRAILEYNNRKYSVSEEASRLAAKRKELEEQYEKIFGLKQTESARMQYEERLKKEEELIASLLGSMDPDSLRALGKAAYDGGDEELYRVIVGARALNEMDNAGWPYLFGNEKESLSLVRRTIEYQIRYDDSGDSNELRNAWIAMQAVRMPFDPGSLYAYSKMKYGLFGKMAGAGISDIKIAKEGIVYATVVDSSGFLGTWFGELFGKSENFEALRDSSQKILASVESINQDAEKSGWTPELEARLNRVITDSSSLDTLAGDLYPNPESKLQTFSENAAAMVSPSVLGILLSKVPGLRNTAAGKRLGAIFKKEIDNAGKEAVARVAGKDISRKSGIEAVKAAGNVDGEIANIGKIIRGERTVGAETLTQAEGAKIYSRVKGQVKSLPSFGEGSEGKIVVLPEIVTREYPSISEKDVVMKIRTAQGPTMPFDSQARILNELADEGIAPRVYASSKEFYIADSISGKSISELTASQRVKLRPQLKRMTDILTQKGILIEDLGGTNIRLASDGRLKLVDVGTAKRVITMPREKLAEFYADEIEGIVSGVYILRMPD